MNHVLAMTHNRASRDLDVLVEDISDSGFHLVQKTESPELTGVVVPQQKRRCSLGLAGTIAWARRDAK